MRTSGISFNDVQRPESWAANEQRVLRTVPRQPWALMKDPLKDGALSCVETLRYWPLVWIIISLVSKNRNWQEAHEMPMKQTEVI